MSSPVRYVSIIQSNIESGPNSTIYLNLLFNYIIQFNIHSLIFNSNVIKTLRKVIQSFNKLSKLRIIEEKRFAIDCKYVVSFFFDKSVIGHH